MLRENARDRNLKCDSTDANNWGGATRSSDEAAVMAGGAKGLR